MSKIKRRVIVVFSVLVLIAILAFGIITFQFFKSTMTYDELMLSFSQQSQKHAENFFSIFDSQNKYVYSVSSDGDSGNPEELFIARIKPFRRYVQAASSIGSEVWDCPAGVYKFTAHDKNGQMEPLHSLILFSANKEHIYRYVYTLNTNGNSAKFEKRVTSGQEFVSTIPNLGTMNNVKTQVTDIKFYNTDEKLVYEYKTDYIP